jgi:hypothetical protein
MRRIFRATCLGARFTKARLDEDLGLGWTSPVTLC